MNALSKLNSIRLKFHVLSKKSKKSIIFWGGGGMKFPILSISVIFSFGTASITLI